MHNKKETKVTCPKCNHEFEVGGSGEELKTGLYWEGKRTDVERISLPFQAIETINESRATREELKKMPLARGMGMDKAEETGWKNKLIWGDNKYVMSSLLDELASKINLVYIDPPFATGADFSINMKMGDVEWTKEASVIEEKAYRDTWGKGLDSYLQMMYDRLLLMRELLADNGSIYVHLDWHVGHYVKIIMDEIFGGENFVNQVVWRYEGPQSPSPVKFASKYDIILRYAKSFETCASYELYFFEKIPSEEAKFKIDENGKYYYTLPKGDYTEQSLKKLEKEGRLFKTKSGNIRIKYFVQKVSNGYFLRRKKIPDVWTDIHSLGLTAQAREAVGFPTQKPEALLERIIKASSNKDDLVADLFCGSGTTLAVAEKMKDENDKPVPRRWVGCDLSRFAIHTTRKRLLEIDGCRPFEVLNLGKYERQYWQGITFGDKKKKDTKKTISEYLQFIVKLYQAEPVTGFRYLHGKKGRKMVSVGSVDAPVTLREIQEALEECKQAGQKELDVLGWEWEMGLHDVVEEESKARGINLHLKTIPREVMDTRAVDSGNIKFFELAYLDAKVSENKYDEFEVELKDFVIQNTDLIPEEVRKKIKKWSDYIDYWAVDWEYKDDTFHNQWQSYRTRKDRTLQLKSDGHKYDKKGKYTIMIKVIDIFGNDTTRVEEVTV